MALEIKVLESTLKQDIVKHLAIGLLLGVGDFIKAANTVDIITIYSIASGSSQNPRNRITGFGETKQPVLLAGFAPISCLTVTQMQKWLMKKNGMSTNYCLVRISFSFIAFFILSPSFRHLSVPILLPFDRSFHTSEEFLKIIGMMAVISAITTVVIEIISRWIQLDNLQDKLR